MQAVLWAKEQPAPAAPVAPDQTAGAASKLQFPTEEAAPCAHDADCDYNYKYAMKDGRCCAGTCTPSAVTQASVKRIEAYCKKVGYDETSCPTKKCAEPPALHCVKKVCRLAK